MAKRVTEQEKEKMWKLYQELGSYIKVAKSIKRSPSTVSAHVREYEAAIRAASYILNTEAN